MLRKIGSIDAFKQLLDDEKAFYFLKHSNTCPISQMAYEEFEKFHYERDMDGYFLVVRENRELSDYISETFNVKHESPQAFYMVNSEVKWHDSHQNINFSNLSQAED